MRRRAKPALPVEPEAEADVSDVKSKTDAKGSSSGSESTLAKAPDETATAEATDTTNAAEPEEELNVTLDRLEKQMESGWSLNEKTPDTSGTRAAETYGQPRNQGGRSSEYCGYC